MPDSIEIGCVVICIVPLWPSIRQVQYGHVTERHGWLLLYKKQLKRLFESAAVTCRQSQNYVNELKEMNSCCSQHNVTFHYFQKYLIISILKRKCVSTMIVSIYQNDECY